MTSAAVGAVQNALERSGSGLYISSMSSPAEKTVLLDFTSTNDFIKSRNSRYCILSPSLKRTPETSSVATCYGNPALIFTNKAQTFINSKKMSSKSKTAMESKEVEPKVRPTRNLKPVDYTEKADRKRAQGASEQDDKKKKKANGNADAAPAKKAGKKKDEASNGKMTKNDEAEVVPESRKRKEAAEETTANSKKGRSKKAEDVPIESAPVDETADEDAPEPKPQKAAKATQKRAKEVVGEETNGGSKKATESKKGGSKVTKSKEPVEATADEEVEVSKPKVTKGKKAVKAAPTAEDEEVKNDEPEKLLIQAMINIILLVQIDTI
ncbi:hypothetical protein Bhyg_05174 [Pseudolycoriella hygida]|uniref:Uncharacterized protein n=1 Tax=Pseudolycoriella hygida TaxID=35572 RepID=A0A9Q0NH84_9DIPT|nr:hypothetical protein Bhyg_05174 [Pseudolycoriella hygida]